MLFMLWSLRMIAHVVWNGFVNESYAMSFAILMLFIVVLTVTTAQISAPFIYTLF